MEKKLKAIILIAIVAGAVVGISLGIYAATTEEEMFDSNLLLIMLGLRPTNNNPTSNEPNDIITIDIGTETINWTLYDDVAPGQYRVWANDTNGNFYVWKDWADWTNNTNLEVEINNTALGTFNFTIEYTDSKNQFGIPDTVIVWVLGNNPISNHPKDIIINASGPETIDWVLLDYFGPGQYRVWANDTNGNYYIWVAWSAWIIGDNLEVLINRTAPGIYNFTIEYNNTNGQFGISDMVIVTIQDNNPTSNHPLDIMAVFGDSQTIDWVLIDDFGPGQYRVWANDSKGNFYVWFNWNNWFNDTNLYVPINCTVPGIYNYTIEFNDSSSQFGNSDTVIVNVSSSNMWTWVSGTSSLDQQGVYGKKGVADENNIPGTRYASASWIDSSGNLWLFGGYGNDNMSGSSYLNDLWKFDGDNWTWVSGNFTRNQPGDYGIIGVPDANNVPGARWEAITWIDDNDHLWLFGGQGRDSANDTGVMNDLWKFDGTNWIWISGSSTRNAYGSYGTKGVADENNVPGARYHSISWIDSVGNFWLFGGWGRNDTGQGYLNDLWKFDGTNWTWVAGSNETGQNGVYGKKGVPDRNNVPGGRYQSISWIDGSDNLWFFGGTGYDNVSASASQLNDLWKFDGSNWTWISGHYLQKQNGNYGIKGVADENNVPGARVDSVSWKDLDGNFWLFGGWGYNDTGYGYLNDLWKYDGMNWTWVSGSDTTHQNGIYGTKGEPNSNNIPGARLGHICWLDLDGSLLIFGGSGYNNITGVGHLNDLWRYII